MLGRTRRIMIRSGREPKCPALPGNRSQSPWSLIIHVFRTGRAFSGRFQLTTDAPRAPPLATWVVRSRHV